MRPPCDYLRTQAEAWGAAAVGGEAKSNGECGEISRAGSVDRAARQHDGEPEKGGGSLLTRAGDGHELDDELVGRAGLAAAGRPLCTLVSQDSPAWAPRV